MKIIFDVKHLYYLPQYLPVYHELTRNNVCCEFVFYTVADKELKRISEQVISKERFSVHWVSSDEEALEYYSAIKVDWIIFGNTITHAEQLHQHSKTALMHHGIGPKSCYYDVSNNSVKVRFVEGQHRLERLESCYPTGTFIDSGYAKLDPAFNNTKNQYTLEMLGLDPGKKTLLYAPTFYPSSIELFSENFANDFSQYNIILKPHFFTLTKPRYTAQRKLLERWQTCENVYLAPTIEYNLVPFMLLSDLLISDASSAIFEFAALGKPIVWCDFYKLRWTYRGLFKSRLKKRLDPDIDFFRDISHQIKHYSHLYSTIEDIFMRHSSKEKMQRKITKELAGLTDGKCSQRITQYLLTGTIDSL